MGTSLFGLDKSAAMGRRETGIKIAELNTADFEGVMQALRSFIDSKPNDADITDAGRMESDIAFSKVIKRDNWNKLQTYLIRGGADKLLIDRIEAEFK